MNEIHSYLKDLAHALHELPDAERVDIIAEIETHIEAGLADGHVGQEISELLQELGSPQALAARYHHLHWKRNWVYFSLATLPLLIINTLTSSLAYYLIIQGLSTSLSKPGALLLCLLMLGISARLRSALLIGWWFGLTVMRSYDLLFLDIGFHSSLWPFLSLVLWVGLLWQYGRFLWRNRSDGFVIATALIPYLWGSATSFIPGTVAMSDNFFRIMLTSTVSGVALTFVILGIFIISNRKRRWQAMLLGTTVCVATTLFIWQGTWYFFWLFLYFPVAVCWLIENRNRLNLHWQTA
jgi:uncharacterized membrane protein